MKQQIFKRPISKSIHDNQAYMKGQIGIGTSFDLGFRELVILKTKIQVYYLTGLTMADKTVKNSPSNCKILVSTIENKTKYCSPKK